MYTTKNFSPSILSDILCIGDVGYLAIKTHEQKTYITIKNNLALILNFNL